MLFSDRCLQWTLIDIDDIHHMMVVWEVFNGPVIGCYRYHGLVMMQRSPGGLASTAAGMSVMLDPHQGVYGQGRQRLAGQICCSFPTVPHQLWQCAGGQTGAAVVMVAERAAEILLRSSETEQRVSGRAPQVALA